jgi:hypothetical protein
MKTIEQLQAEYSSTVRAMDAAKFVLDEAKRAQFQKVTGLQLGNVVVYRGKRYSVSYFHPEYNWVYGKRILKSEKIGKTEHNLFSCWTKEETNASDR